MTGRGPHLCLCLVLNLRQVIVFYCVLSHPSLVLPAIAENGYLFLFFHPLVASAPFHSCTYVEVVAVLQVVTSVLVYIVCPLAGWP